ncbi:hypothetical protein B0H11DRAFT_2283228 [Mycena galericulata]|nr:hypothetical protein B0H11DRAFT_2283228 [Mycena galericulata]
MSASTSNQPGSSTQNGTSNGASASSSYSSRVAQAVSNLSSTASNLVQASSPSAPGGGGASGANANPSAFRAPAHKHAHHLHSIPPREKSTRTLIIDHMLWVHGRTRFAQARAELGMTDRTGGPGTPQYAHRHRPENYEEEDDVGSDGEDAVTLKARAGDPGRPHNDDEDERLRSQDLVLARSLRLRAEGLEKVVTSMLDQPPPAHRILDEDLLTPPTSPRIFPTGRPNSGPTRYQTARPFRRTGTDGRVAHPPPPPRPSRAPPPTTSTAPPDHALPPALSALATVSASYPDQPNVQPWTRPSSSMRPGPGPLYPVQPRSPPVPSSLTRALYMAGADPSTANSPPAFRCPRHLHTGCEICVEANSIRVVRAAGRERRSGRRRSFESGGTGGRGAVLEGDAWWGEPRGRGITGWQTGAGLGRAGRSPRARVRCCAGDEGRMGTWRARRGGVHGCGNNEARWGARRVGEEEEPASPVEDKEDGEGDGEESSTSPASTERGGWEGAPPDLELLPPPATPVLPLRPSRRVVLLLAGLLTRAVLEGYLTAGWRGPDAVDCLLKVGLGMRTESMGAGAPPKETLAEEFAEFDPTTTEPAGRRRMLFPALRDGRLTNKGLAEEEFEMEMETRLRRFYDIPQSTPDLSTHMEDLAWQYPPSPSSAPRCASARQSKNGAANPSSKPSYKKKPPSSVRADTPSSASMAIDTLVHHGSPATSTPGTVASVPGSMSAPPPVHTMHVPRSTRKPSIEVYFPQPFPQRRHAWNANRAGNKRMRSEDDGGEGATKVARNGRMGAAGT